MSIRIMTMEVRDTSISWLLRSGFILYWKMPEDPIMALGD
jgi:hypothetical protein